MPQHRSGGRNPCPKPPGPRADRAVPRDPLRPDHDPDFTGSLSGATSPRGRQAMLIGDRLPAGSVSDAIMYVMPAGRAGTESLLPGDPCAADPARRSSRGLPPVVAKISRRGLSPAPAATACPSIPSCRAECGDLLCALAVFLLIFSTFPACRGSSSRRRQALASPTRSRSSCSCRWLMRPVWTALARVGSSVAIESSSGHDRARRMSAAARGGGLALPRLCAPGRCRPRRTPGQPGGSTPASAAASVEDTNYGQPARRRTEGPALEALQLRGSTRSSG
jgi:hypothetical protein